MLEINSLRCSSPIFFDMFLEKTKLEYDSSNDADWVRDLRIILIVAQKNYVLDAPLDDKPIAGAAVDIMNIWQSSIWWLLDSLVHHALRLRTGTSKNVLNATKHMRCSKSWNWYFRLMHVSSGMRPLPSTLPTRWRRIAQLVSMCSECLGTIIAWIKWKLIFPAKIVIDRVL